MTQREEKKSISPTSNLKEGENDIAPVKKGPISFLSGALTSGLLCWASFFISKKVVIYFSLHTVQYSSPVAQSVASGFKTLIEGMCFLATFTFGFIGIGLILVFVRSLFDGKSDHSD